MRFVFSEFCLDAEQRALTFRDREVALQPKALDLLAYLLQHRDRVVGKDELLEQLWPGVAVTDGSLKRAVSLVRAALQEGGADGAIRTYQRHGYRFLGPEVAESARAIESSTDLERDGLAALHRGRARDAIDPLQRAVAFHAERGDRPSAARCAFHLAQLHFEQRELTVGRGWLRRGASYLDEGETREHGHRAWLASRYAVAEGDIDEAVREAELAHAIGRRLGDANLEALGLLYKGLALVALGEVRRGCAHHDEAAAAVLSTDVSAWAAGLVYCGMIFTCRNRADWRRAAEWTKRFMKLCDGSGLAAFPGTCRLHRAEVLHISGAIDEAEREAAMVTSELAGTAPWAEGDGFHILGDLHLTRGALDEAETAYRRAHELGWDPQPGLAQLLVARGKAVAGLRSLQRSLASRDWTIMQRRGLLLSQLVHVALAAGDPTAAREALGELDRCPELWQTPALEAAVSEARAAVLMLDDDLATAASSLQHSVRLYLKTSPLHAVRARISLAEVLSKQGDVDAADLELAAASAALSQLDAAPLRAELDRVRALLRGPT